MAPNQFETIESTLCDTAMRCRQFFGQLDIHFRIVAM
jgi:hypothetical protein